MKTIEKVLFGVIIILLIVNIGINKEEYTKSWNHIISKAIICDETEVKIGFSCVEKVKCIDGTYDKECSLTKPLQCLNGTFVNSSDKCGCPVNFTKQNISCRTLFCDDNTIEPECSKTKPFQCMNNELVKNPKKCGCPEDYFVKNNDCVKKCDDETLSTDCSRNKPYFCDDGDLIKKSSVCGCNYGDVPDGEDCVSKYHTNPKKISLLAKSNRISYIVYSGLNDYLAGIDRSISYMEGSPQPSDYDFIIKSLNNVEQKKELDPLVDEIRKLSTDSDKQALLAINMVQNIDYDWDAFNNDEVTGKYPYEVIYTESGVCSEKSQLMAYMLRELGYATAILRFDVENHDAVGVKCPSKYEYKNTGYCFIEATSPSSIGDSYGNYVGVGTLKSTPKVIRISDGKSFQKIN